jgi:hypothetical protein
VVDGVLASCYTEESGTYGRLFQLLPEEMAPLKHWGTHHTSLATLLRFLHGAVPEWFVPRTEALQLKGGWSHLPASQRWMFVGEGLLAALKQQLMRFSLRWVGTATASVGDAVPEAANAKYGPLVGRVTL